MLELEELIATRRPGWSLQRPFYTDPEVLAEAAAAASVPLDLCLEAAGDTGRDAQIQEAGRRLLAAGADDLPAIRLGRRVYSGEERLEEAALVARSAGTARFHRPVTA